MSGSRIYLDWNAGAPMAAAVRDHMVETIGRTGNASSVHTEGRTARAAVEAARRKVATLVGAKPASVAFT